MNQTLKIGTRDSQLAVWQASLVKEELAKQNIKSELVFIKTEGDVNLVTPLYEIGVQGIFTKTLDAALLSNRVDIAVHSMKDVPTQLAKGISQAAVLPRASYKDIFVYKEQAIIEAWQLTKCILNSPLDVGGTIATSSIRRKAQWLHRYPNHRIENLRGNINTRLKKIEEHNWNGAIFAAAGLERIRLRPESSIELDWMLPAPAQGAIMVVCRTEDDETKDVCSRLNHGPTALCTKIEREFLKTLMGGCSTPISALAVVDNDYVHFKGSIFSLDGKEHVEMEKKTGIKNALSLGIEAGNEVLLNGGKQITEAIRNAGK
ncbi:MAG TPA: hydroxymethylbilane synthase [Chitinophagaceae bacterium]|jgi:hydroxymethylbilane synthase